MGCNGLDCCVTVSDTTVIQFKQARTYSSTCGFVKAVTDCEHGKVTFSVRPGSDVAVAFASAAADAPAAIDDDDDVDDTPPPAVESARLPLRLHHLLTPAARVQKMCYQRHLT